MKQAKVLISALSERCDDDPPNNVIGGGSRKKGNNNDGSAAVVVGGAQAKKTPENPLKKELANPSGLDFANQMGAIVAQPTQINMVPPGDET